MPRSLVRGTGKGADLDADLSAIHNAVDSTGPWLAIWQARREPDAFARRCASDAIDAIDAALAALHRIRGQLVTEAARADDEAARADDDEPGGDETYHCPECGSLAGMFIGRQGWWHYTGTGTTADPVQIYDPGHQATPAADALLGRGGGRDDT